MSQVRRAKVNSVAFERAKHFKWTITKPGGIRALDLPSRIYDSAVLQVGGNVVLMGFHQSIWNELRVLFYNIRDHSWKVVNSDGPNDVPSSSKLVLGLVEDKIYVMSAAKSGLYCFDIVLRKWAPLEVEGIAVQGVSCLRCFMENTQGFICWDKSEGPVLSVLDLRHQKWSEHHTKGELPSAIMGTPITSCYGSSVYICWGNGARNTSLHILSLRNTRYYWSKPKGFVLSHRYTSGGSLTYHSGRLFKIGGFGTSRILFIYSIEQATWHQASQSTVAEYTVQGANLPAGGHSAIVLNDKIVVFGGISLEFKACRFLQARSLLSGI